jgi:hypothetical protein
MLAPAGTFRNPHSPLISACQSTSNTTNRNWPGGTIRKLQQYMYLPLSDGNAVTEFYVVKDSACMQAVAAAKCLRPTLDAPSGTSCHGQYQWPHQQGIFSTQQHMEGEEEDLAYRYQFATFQIWQHHRGYVVSWGIPTEDVTIKPWEDKQAEHLQFSKLRNRRV